MTSRHWPVAYFRRQMTVLVFKTRYCYFYRSYLRTFFFPFFDTLWELIGNMKIVNACIENKVKLRTYKWDICKLDWLLKLKNIGSKRK